jgi:hypothetical protein
MGSAVWAGELDAANNTRRIETDASQSIAITLVMRFAAFSCMIVGIAGIVASSGRVDARSDACGAPAHARLAEPEERRRT